MPEPDERPVTLDELLVSTFLRGSAMSSEKTEVVLCHIQIDHP